jgi:hypothetical protein
MTKHGAEIYDLRDAEHRAKALAPAIAVNNP